MASLEIIAKHVLQQGSSYSSEENSATESPSLTFISPFPNLCGTPIPTPASSNPKSYCAFPFNLDEVPFQPSVSERINQKIVGDTTKLLDQLRDDLGGPSTWSRPFDSDVNSIAPISAPRSRIGVCKERCIIDPVGVEMTEQFINSTDNHDAANENDELDKLYLAGKDALNKLENGELSDLEVAAPGIDQVWTKERFERQNDRRLKKYGQRTHFKSKQTSCAQSHGIPLNPKDLLKPYEPIDEDHLQSLHYASEMQRQEKHAATESEGNELVASKAVNILSQELNDELGLYSSLNESSDKILTEASEAEDPSPQKVLSSFDDLHSNMASTGVPSEVDELDSILQIDSENNDSLTKRQPQKVREGKTNEWATSERIDVTEFESLIPDPALKFPFELDSFQKEAIIYVEKGECVFVAAHTSAGKTVVAEYAISLAKKRMTRAIYTSPIKTLSNQKYRDFRQKFGEDVGLITGDVSINANASCLVMTTEILRSMLYRGADIISDIEVVIFDEIHYLNDSERGVVWEEVIIMLPVHVNMIFLSATTPNAFQFSDWIGRTKKKRIHVISTTKRPVPLEHFFYANGEFIKLMDSKGVFIPSGHSKTRNLISTQSSGKQKQRGGRESSLGRSAGKGGGPSSDRGKWTKCIRFLEKKKMLPVIVFAFSKRVCEESATKLANLDLSTSGERHEAHIFLNRSIQRLQGSDQQLPQVLKVKEMCLRGIGMHHSGLLPIIKEMVEILFCRGLIKVLFATETFAMGVNAPARSVIFNGTRKHDGKCFRQLLPGEYIQMAGRAGRRGLDDFGTVILACWDDVPELQACHTMMKGQATKLVSQFRLTYTMILNLLRVEDLTVEEMIKRSFSEFGSQKELAAQNVNETLSRCEKLLLLLRSQVENEKCIKGGDLEIGMYYELLQERMRIAKYIHEEMLRSKYGPGLLSPGRLLTVQTKQFTQALAVVLKATHAAGGDINSIKVTALLLSPDNSERSDKFEAANLKDDANSFVFEVGSFHHSMGKCFQVVELKVKDIFSICKDKCTAEIRNLLPGFAPIRGQNSYSLYNTAIDFLKKQENAAGKFPEEINGRADLKLNSMEFIEAQEYLDSITLKLDTCKCNSCPQQASLLDLIAKINRVESHCNQLRFAVSNASLSLFPDFIQRLKVMETLGYIKNRTVQLKGSAASIINTCDELILTEMIFENLLSSLDPAEMVAILSALIFQDRRAANDVLNLTSNLEEARKRTIKIAESLAVLQLEMSLDLDPVEYIEQLNFGLVEVVYEWARGMPFKDICELTLVQEGSIVRCINRLHEVCNEVKGVARLVGDPRLFRKMEMASELIKRDVIFAASLYV